MSRKATEVTNTWLSKWPFNSIYHAWDINGRMVLCDCGRECVIRERLGIDFGYRSRVNGHKRDNYLRFDFMACERKNSPIPQLT